MSQDSSTLNSEIALDELHDSQTNTIGVHAQDELYIGHVEDQNSEVHQDVVMQPSSQIDTKFSMKPSEDASCREMLLLQQMSQKVTSVTKVTKQLEMLMEHESLSEMLHQIPQKVQRGLKTHYEPLELTSIDANQYFIALGSNVGTVYLFDREKCTLQRLKAENTSDSVTCVCLHHGLDDFVGIGFASGTIYIFQLPSIMMGHSKKLERFIVADVYKSPISCLTWSTNGMKLYSGDKSGCVGCVQVDFHEGKSKSSVLLTESNTEIVQLNYCHKSLLVSTKHRCFVYRADPHNQLVQIGSKDRKIPADFGACFIPAMCKLEDTQLYASRPGLRIWKAAINGSVLNTFIFKDLLTQTNAEIPLLKFEITSIFKPQNPNQFGPLLLFREKELVTWNDNCLYVLNPENLSLIGVQKHIGAIKSVAVSEHEIFVLRTGTDRNVIRISDQPAVRPTSRLLKLLEAERKSAENKHDVQSTEMHSNKHESARADNEEVTVTVDLKKEELSPFKAFGGHILEKVKKIPKPLELKEKIKKLNLDRKLYSRGTSSTEDSKNPLTKNDPSPITELPPVVKLQLPDFLTIKAFEIENAVKTVDVTVAGSSGNKTDNVGPSVQDGSVLMKSSFPPQENPDDLSARKRLGSGAISALSRLQEEHQNEEGSEHTYKMAEQLPFKTKLLIVQGEDDESSIVYKKVKPKHAKKKARSPKIKDKKPDTVLENQTAIITSEMVTSTADNSYIENLNGLVPHNSQSGFKLGSETQSVVKYENMANIECLTVTQPKIVSNVHAEIVDSEPRLEVEIEPQSEIQDTYQEQFSIMNATKLASEVDTGKITDQTNEKEISISAGKEIVPQRETRSTVNGVDKLSANVEAEPALATSEHFNVYFDDGNKSSLDIEVAKLDSYLGGSSTSGQNFDDDSDRKSVELEVKDIFNAYNKYTPSALEKELQELEMSTVTETNAVLRDKKFDMSRSTMISCDYNTPSLYSTCNTPDAKHDDFYSKFSPFPTETSLESNKSASTNTKDTIASNEIKTENSEELLASPYFLTTVNIWTEITANGSIHSLSTSSTHVWITDKSNNIYYCILTEPKICWKKAIGNASQISVSKNGNIVWGLYKNTVYAGTKITAHHPEGLKWVEAVKDVAYISVDETCAWYIKTNMQVMMQQGLSRNRPFYKAQEVPCAHRLKQIECQSGVVWALTENCKWLYRSDITLECPEGKDWVFGNSGSENHLFSHIALGDHNLGWATDVADQVWFCTGVTMETPNGENQWWQVSLMGEYIFKDMSTLDLLRSFSKKMDPQKLSLLLSSQSGGLITGVSGVWVCPEYQNVLHVCRGNIEGHVWKESTPGNLPNTTCWKSVVASTAHLVNGIIWAQQPNGDLFAFNLTDQKICHYIPVPLDNGKNISFGCMSVCTNALWGLTSNGVIYIRTGVTELVPHGYGWSKLDLSQLDQCQLVHVSCANESVWAVDNFGNVYHRIGVKAPTDHGLNAAWLPVDNGGTVFTQVIAGEQDWMVWAIDNQRQVYVRGQITEGMPIGRQWIHVSGSMVLQLTLSRHYVWGLNQSGELLCRHGVRQDNVTGDYWKKISVNLTYISTTPNNQLWGINKDGQLLQRHTRYICKGMKDLENKGTCKGARGYSISSDDAEWEFV